MFTNKEFGQNLEDFNQICFPKSLLLQALLLIHKYFISERPQIVLDYGFSGHISSDCTQMRQKCIKLFAAVQFYALLHGIY